jgi:hypothetical protein
MPRCGCQDACSCLLVAGPGVNVDGLGTVDRPYEISAESALLSENLVFDNVGTVDFTTAGLGTPVSPLRVSANAALKMTDLADVQGTPLSGEVPVWVGDHWDFQTVAGGSTGSSVTVQDPITGQGTAAAPIGLALTLGTGLAGQGTSADPLRWINPATADPALPDSVDTYVSASQTITAGASAETPTAVRVSITNPHTTKRMLVHRIGTARQSALAGTSGLAYFDILRISGGSNEVPQWGIATQPVVVEVAVTAGVYESLAPGETSVWGISAFKSATVTAYTLKYVHNSVVPIRYL